LSGGAGERVPTGGRRPHPAPPAADAGPAPAHPAKMGDPPPLSLGERILAWRDRILAAPAFQRWAAAFPLTRPIALSRSRRVFDLCAGFVYSQAMLAAVRLDLFARLSNGPVPPEELAEACELPLERLERLLGAGTAVGLFRRTRSGRVALGALGAPLVGNEALARMVEHNVLLYHDLADPVSLLREGPGERGLLRGYWAYARSADARALTPDQVGPYSALMAASQPLVSREILDAYPFSRHRRVLDVGGGEGAFLEAVGLRHPRLELALFDLPAVAERGRARLTERFSPSRVHVSGGDFFRDPLPKGADLVTLVRILHDHDDAEAGRILRAVREALPRGGRVVVAEPMAGVRGAETVGAAYFSLYLLAMGQGRPRSPAEYRALLSEAGFRGVRSPRPRAPVLTGVVTGVV
jgi:demethylspheroidene O-methyltransferase